MIDQDRLRIFVLDHLDGCRRDPRRFPEQVGRPGLGLVAQRRDHPSVGGGEEARQVVTGRVDSGPVDQHAGVASTAHPQLAPAEPVALDARAQRRTSGHGDGNLSALRRARPSRTSASSARRSPARRRAASRRNDTSDRRIQLDEPFGHLLDRQVVEHVVSGQLDPMRIGNEGDGSLARRWPGSPSTPCRRARRSPRRARRSPARRRPERRRAARRRAPRRSPGRTPPCAPRRRRCHRRVRRARQRPRPPGAGLPHRAAGGRAASRRPVPAPGPRSWTPRRARRATAHRRRRRRSRRSWTRRPGIDFQASTSRAIPFIGCSRPTVTTSGNDWRCGRQLRQRRSQPIDA